MRYVISIGSNIGNRKLYIKSAVELLLRRLYKVDCISHTRDLFCNIECLEVVKLTKKYIKSSRRMSSKKMLFDKRITISRIYETEALLPESSPAEWNMPFLNVAITFDIMLLPKDMLLTLKKVEREIGRTTSAKWAPRVVDLDIIFAGQEIVYEPHNVSNFLIIPHKEFMNRNFFILPVVDIAPDYVHPLFNIKISEIL